MSIENVLVKPLMTEKSSLLTDDHNRYAFVVNLKSNKNQIKKAVEELFNVKVEKVATSILPGKMKRAGRFVSKSGKTKKAYVTIQKDQKIEFFKGI